MPPREKPPVGNPLFLKWMEELRDAAREKGMKSAETYAKACRSIEACPVVYERPRELAQLQGIGAKTVDILEARYKRHCEQNGIEHPANSPARPKSKARVATPPSDTEDAAAQPPAKKRKSRAKAYIPQSRSGGYGILLALALTITPAGPNPTPADCFTRRESLTRGEIARAAQPYCDTSYTHSEKGTYFTAWSSMKTLVIKGYVYVSGSPQKYSLTEEGYDIAATLRNMNPDVAHLPKLPLLDSSIGDEVTLTTTQRSPERSLHLSPPPSPGPSHASPPPSVKPRSTTQSGKFRFWYIDSAGARVINLADAATRLDPEDYVTIRKIEFRASQRAHPFVSQLKLVDAGPRIRDASGQATVFAYVVDEGAPPRCSRFQEDDDAAQPESRAKDVDTRARLDQALPRPVSALSGRQTSFLSPAPSSTGRSDSITSLPSSSRGLTASSASLIPQPTKPFDPVHDTIIFPAGSYKIILVIDSREVESRSNRDKIAETLAAKGVKVETRALRLGDMCWVAKRVTGRVGGDEDECVLDYVVERKRLDDLCFSIRDGRYHEQCHRLSNSGIGHVYYIIEDWQVAERMEFHGLQINTAKSQIQVHNGFFLKETHKLTETIDFLAAVTDVIQSSVGTQDLRVIPTRYLSRSTYTDLQRRLRSARSGTPGSGQGVPYHTTFEAYQDMNDKTGTRTLTERFARMLLCVRGMSAERVSAIVEVYSTPTALWDAIKRRLEEARVEEKDAVGGESTAGVGMKKKGKVRGVDMFFADHFPGEGRRKIGDAQSRELWKALMGDEAVV